jgi:hypothetical protein
MSSVAPAAVSAATIATVGVITASSAVAAAAGPPPGIAGGNQQHDQRDRDHADTDPDFFDSHETNSPSRGAPVREDSRE